MAKHGTNSQYNNQACRCSSCKQAHSVYRKQTRLNPPKPKTPWKHGTVTGYYNGKCRCADCKAYYSRHNRAWKYSISIEELDEFLSIAECEACGSKEKLVIDHDHTSGNVRGLLCHKCNVALGMAGDKASRMLKLVQYLLSKQAMAPPEQGQQ